MLAIAITYAIQLSGIFQYMIRLSARVETLMTCTERLLYYARELPAETGPADPVNLKPDWPQVCLCACVCVCLSA
jgi:hypothetical protein